MERNLFFGGKPRAFHALGSAALVITLASIMLSGCAHVQPAQGLEARIAPDQLLVLACSPGQDLISASGVVSMKVKSPDGSGQFSANIKAEAPDVLDLEVLQPMGGTWARVAIRGNVYTIDVPGKPEQSRKGRDVWAGIPLRFATDLFLGRVPCPSKELSKATPPQIDEQDELVVGTAASTERYLFRFRENAGKFWPSSLHWESRDLSGAIVVDFKFDDPESSTRSPLKWEAKSNRGEVKVRWRDRNHSP